MRQRGGRAETEVDNYKFQAAEVALHETAKEEEEPHIAERVRGARMQE